MHVEIVDGHDQVNSRKFNTDSGPREAHDQPAYLHIPGAPFPLPFRLGIEHPNQAYSPGMYVFAPECIRTNKFGGLEFDRYNMRLIRANVKTADLKSA